ncbi:MAG TPA: hypothetical protein PLI65_09525 [Bacteroidales bacterium]|nr:hypothetical protein [Bacteroidales bacterium]
MKYSSLLILVLLMGNFGLKSQNTSGSRILIPENYKKRVTLLVSGKPRHYYALDHEHSSVINVSGPGKLKIISRVRFVENQHIKKSYQLRYSIDGGQERQVKLSGVTPSKVAVYDDEIKGHPGQSRETEISLGRGAHTIAVSIPDASASVDVRYVFKPTKGKKTSWIAFAPNRPSEPVELISKETNVKYYRFSRENPLRAEITGPTELRVLTRIENHFNMKGRIHYRLQVKDNNQVLHTFQLSSTHSEVAVYKDESDLVPGKPCEVVIEVPAGRHCYEIYPLDEDKNTLLGRMLIPKKDVRVD